MTCAPPKRCASNWSVPRRNWDDLWSKRLSIGLKRLFETRRFLNSPAMPTQKKSSDRSLYYLGMLESRGLDWRRNRGATEAVRDSIALVVEAVFSDGTLSRKRQDAFLTDANAKRRGTIANEAARQVLHVLQASGLAEEGMPPSYGRARGCFLHPIPLRGVPSLHARLVDVRSSRLASLSARPCAHKSSLISSGWPCPLSPQKRTFVSALSMSALCQKQTFGGAGLTRVGCLAARIA